jgi:hypothetical protein
MEIQVIERKDDTSNGSVLTKGKDFIRHDEWSFNGLCIAYRTIRVLDNLLKVEEYHHCQDEEDIEENILYKWAYVETDVSKVLSITSIKQFNEFYQHLYECIKRHGWGKTVKCR